MKMILLVDCNLKSTGGHIADENIISILLKLWLCDTDAQKTEIKLSILTPRQSHFLSVAVIVLLNCGL